MTPGNAPAASVHATAVAFAGRGFLIFGRAGSGKTRLALEMIALGADLVADDRVLLAPRPGGGVLLRPPPALAGLIELRGAGVLRHPWLEEAPLWLAADLDIAAASRMPPRIVREIAGRETVVLPGGPPAHAAMFLAILRAGVLPDPEAMARPLPLRSGLDG